MYAPPRLSAEFVPLLERTVLSENTRKLALIFDQNRASPAPARSIYKLRRTTPIALVIQMTNKGVRGIRGMIFDFE